jgi:DNA-directed RNA polymerase I, II, and III subunit RPABC1
MERWWRINRTLVQKLQDTGYEVRPEDEAQVASIQAFEEAYPDALIDSTTMERKFLPLAGTMAESRAPNGVFLAFGVSEGKNILLGHVDRLEKALQTNRVTTAFFVVNRPIHAKAASYLRTLADTYRIVVFRQEQLVFNVSRHRRVPKHRLFTPYEASRWLSSTLLKRSQLPRIFEDDAMAKYYDALPTDLVAVTNPSPTVDSFTRVLVVARRLAR